MSNHLAVLQDRIGASVIAKQRLLDDSDTLEALVVIANELVTAVSAGGTVFFCGNGGSSTDAQHMSAELLGRFYRDRNSLPSVCLSDNTAAMTAIGNDYSYEEVFSRQISGLGRPGDVLVGLSTSGNSANVLRAVEVAKTKEITTIGFTGLDGGKLAPAADFAFRAPSNDTPRIQECHLLVGHILCEIIENEVFPAS
jgi:D-sedoheptulose 7-phosphate isomerase